MCLCLLKFHVNCLQTNIALFWGGMLHAREAHTCIVFLFVCCLFSLSLVPYFLSCLQVVIRPIDGVLVRGCYSLLHEWDLQFSDERWVFTYKRAYWEVCRCRVVWRVCDFVVTGCLFLLCYESIKRMQCFSLALLLLTCCSAFLCQVSGSHPRMRCMDRKFGCTCTFYTEPTY